MRIWTMRDMIDHSNMPFVVAHTANKHKEDKQLAGICISFSKILQVHTHYITEKFLIREWK